MKRIVLLLAALLAWAGLALAAVNVNTATKEQLETLDGIGPVKAQAIIDYRNKNGPFKKLEDVKNVNGIGDVTFEKIRTHINLTGQTTVPAAPAAPSSKAEARPKADEKKVEPKPAAAPKADEKKAEPKPDPKAEAKAKADAKKAEERSKK
jgi:competence protein ComEA